MFSVKNILYALLIIVYFLHNDLWLWYNPALILGIPIGLFYHILFCVAASILMVLLIKYAWPDFSEDEDKLTTDASDN